MHRAVVGVFLALLACNGSGKGTTRTGTPTGSPGGNPGGTAVSPPRAEDDLASVDEGGAVTIDVASNDLVTTNPLALGSVTVIDPPPFGTVTVNSDGTVEYQHDASEGSDDTFTYSIEDNQGIASNVATVQITVNPVNDLPVAVNDSAGVAQWGNVPIDLAGNDFDVDDGLDLASIAITVQPTYGTLTLYGDGTVDYAQDGSGVTTDEFRYTIEDMSGDLSNEAVVAVTIYTSNTPPIAVDDQVFVDEGGNTNVLVIYNDIDIDDGIDPTSLVLTSPPSNGTATPLPDGSFDYVHDGSETTNDSFSYEVLDNSAAPSNGATVTVFVNPVNDPPISNDDVAAVDENLTVNVDVLANDVDVDDGLDPLSVTPVQQPQYGTLFVNPDGSIDYTHDGSQVTADSFTYTVDDYAGASTAEATVDVTITLINDPPVAVDDAGAVDEGGGTVVDLVANDSDSDSAIDLATLTIVTGAANGTVVDNGDGTIDYTHDGSETTSDSFTYTIDDVGGETSNIATVSMTVNPINDPPVASGDNYAVGEGSGPTAFDVLTNDSDVDDGIDPSSVQVVSAPANGTAVEDPGTGNIEYTHDGSETTADSFTYQVDDFSGATSNVVTVNITVNSTNDPPVASGDAYTVDEGSGPSALDVLWNDTDPDDGIDAGTVQIVSGPSNGTAVPNALGDVDYTHDGSETTSDSFTYRVEDFAGALSNTVTVNITVDPVNDPPVANDDLYLVDEGAVDAPLTVLVNDTDVDDGLDFGSQVIVSGPSNGSAFVNGNNILYSHNGTETTSDSLTYQVFDNTGAPSNVATANITINPVNDAPVAVNDLGNNVDNGQVVNIDVWSNDTDVDSALDAGSVFIMSLPGNGVAIPLGDGSVDYVHDGSPTTSDTFTYTIQDIQGAVSNQATVEITINPAPVAGGGLFAIRTADDMLVNIDRTTFATTDVGPLGIDMEFGGMTWDPGAGVFWLVDGRGGTTSLYSVDPATGAATLIGSHGITDMCSLQIDAAGTLWAWNPSHALYTMNKTTGAATAVGVSGSVGSWAAMAWDSTRSEMRAVYYPGEIYDLDMSTGIMTDLGNPTPIYLNNLGGAYDPEQDVFWAAGYSGNITMFDPNNGYLQTEVSTGGSALDGLAFKPSVALVGQFNVNDGPGFFTNPPTYTCQEACAMLFGGNASSYQCSTSSTAIDNMAYTSTYGVGGCNVYPQDFKVGVTYSAPGDVSTWVTDNCVTAPNTNYCYQ